MTGDPLLSIRNVSVKFAGIIALDGVSLDVARGDICGLIGPNGAGKTTLFNCLSRLYTPSSGAITFEGTSLLDAPAHKIAQLGIGRTFQNLALFKTMTVRCAVRSAAEMDQWLYLFSLIIAVVLFLIAWKLLRGSTGIAIAAIRDHPIAARTMGINISLYKTMTFGVSAMFTGIAGALGALVAQFVSPDSFTIFLSLSLLVGAVVGGVATIFGAIFGALFIEFVPNFADQISKAVTWAVYGLFMIAFMYLMPNGIVGRSNGWPRGCAAANPIIPLRSRRRCAVSPIADLRSACCILPSRQSRIAATSKADRAFPGPFAVLFICSLARYPAC